MSKKICVISSMVFLVLGAAFGFIQEDKSGQEREIEELIGRLGTRFWEEAADELVKIGEAAVGPLIATVNIGSGRPSENAVLVLARLGTSEAMDAVLGALKNQKFDGRIRGYAASALGDTGSEDHVGPLIEALQSDSSWWVRHTAVVSLGKIGPERAIGPLIGAMDDENQYVRRSAVSVLGELKSERALLPLIRAMKDEDWQIRLQVADILVEFGNKAEKSLLEALKEENNWVKVGAANILGRLEAEDAVFPLIFLLEDQERMVRDEAAVALSRINTEGMIDPLLELLKHDTGYVREEAAWVLGEIKANDAVPSLIQALDDGDMGWMAAVSLGKIGDERAIDYLKRKTADQDSRVGKASTWALFRMKRN